MPRGRYRLDSRDSLAMEMPDGSFQRTVTVKSAFLTLGLRSQGSYFAADIRLDSIVFDRITPLQPMADSARDTRWVGRMALTGRFDSLSTAKPTMLGEQVRAMLNRLVPVLPDSGAAPGERWTDSTSVPYRVMAGFDATEERRAEFRAGKWESSGDTSMLPIQSTMTYAVSGSGSGFGQEIQIEGGGRTRGTHRLSAAGILLRAEVTDSVTMTLTVPAVGQSVPAVVVTTYSLTPLF